MYCERYGAGHRVQGTGYRGKNPVIRWHAGGRQVNADFFYNTTDNFRTEYV